MTDIFLKERGWTYTPQSKKAPEPHPRYAWIIATVYLQHPLFSLLPPELFCVVRITLDLNYRAIHVNIPPIR